MSAVRVWSYASPIGDLAFATAEGAVIAASFEALDGRFRRGVERLAPGASIEEIDADTAVVDGLDAYFSGDREALARIPWRIEGDGFRQRVWRALAEIPAGAVISYGEMARRAGEPGGAQAAGVALNRNPIPLVLPCHRVTGADGALVGFGGGIERKRWLLAHEGALLL